MDPSLYTTRGGGLTLAQLLEELENEDIVAPINIYTEVPDDGDITECDSDISDEECEGNLNHLGPKLLLSQCEYEIRTKQVQNTEQGMTADDNTLWESSDDEPLAHYLNCAKTKSSRGKRKVPILNWKSGVPEFRINTDCQPRPISEEAKNCSTPLEFFKLFFSEELLNQIVEETNKYAMQKNCMLNMTNDELYVFLGALALSGYAKYPNKRIFWSGSKDVPLILQDSMRLNRFEQILRNFHLNDNSVLDSQNRLYKLQPLIDHLNEKFKYHGGLDENLSIDESMIPYFGRHYAKQYIRGKPIRFGFKNWALCTSNGYMVAFKIYTGKSEEQVTFGIGGDTVVSLIGNAEVPPHKGFKIYFDNYFSSLALFSYLSTEGYAATGTIQEGRIRQCPLMSRSEMEKQSRGTYDYKTDCDNSVCIIRWKDNKVVSCATNFDEVKEGKCLRWSKEQKKRVYISQPEVFAHYNKYMGGVDKMDQLVAVYRTRMRQRKWWWPIFCYLFDVSICNAWLLMKKVLPNSKECSSLLIFRRHIATVLLQSHGIRSSRGRTAPDPVGDMRYDGREHWPEYVSTERVCRSCSGKSKFICTKCKVGLHPKMCFKNFHTF